MSAGSSPAMIFSKSVGMSYASEYLGPQEYQNMSGRPESSSDALLSIDYFMYIINNLYVTEQRIPISRLASAPAVAASLRRIEMGTILIYTYPMYLKYQPAGTKQRAHDVERTRGGARASDAH